MTILSIASFFFIVHNGVCEEYIDISNFLREQTPKNETEEYIRGWNDCISAFDDNYINNTYDDINNI